MVSDKQLMEQGADTAHTWLRKAIESIDDLMGEGAAKANPALVAAMLQASAADFATIKVSESIDRLADAVHTGLSNMG